MSPAAQTVSVNMSATNLTDVQVPDFSPATPHAFLLSSSHDLPAATAPDAAAPETAAGVSEGLLFVAFLQPAAVSKRPTQIRLATERAETDALRGNFD